MEKMKILLKQQLHLKIQNLGIPILVGKEEKIKEQIKKIGYNENFDIEIVNSKDTEKREKYVNIYLKNYKENKVIRMGL